MYPEDEGAQMDSMPSGGFKSRASYHLEGLIPLILIVIIVAYLGMQFGFWDLPFIGGQQPAQMLIIGEPSFDTKYVLDQNPDLVKYRIRTAESLERSPKEQLAQYDIIMLDQSYQANKEVSRQLGEAIENYVKTGGKLITVMDSGILRKGAADIVGWKATFGDIVPVSCERGQNDMPTCLPNQAITIVGRIWRQDFDHKIMEGIEVAPAEPEAAIFLTVFDVAPVGNEIAYVQTIPEGKFYPAIVEKPLIIGKSIYFNYDPGRTRGIFEKTLKYLK